MSPAKRCATLTSHVYGGSLSKIAQKIDCSNEARFRRCAGLPAHDLHLQAGIRWGAGLCSVLKMAAMM